MAFFLLRITTALPNRNLPSASTRLWSPTCMRLGSSRRSCGGFRRACPRARTWTISGMCRPTLTKSTSGRPAQYCLFRCLLSGPHHPRGTGTTTMRNATRLRMRRLARIFLARYAPTATCFLESATHLLLLVARPAGSCHRVFQQHLNLVYALSRDRLILHQSLLASIVSCCIPLQASFLAVTTVLCARSCMVKPGLYRRTPYLDRINRR